MMSTMTTNADGEQNLDLSYAKVSGAIGSIAISSLFVGLGYYILYALYLEQGDTFSLKESLNGLGTYFLAGAALFLPYAFEKLSTVFAK